MKTTPFHPECDGQSERAVQTIKRMLTPYTNEDQNNWDEFLPQLSYAYNSSIHQSTNFSPFEVTFGYQARMPIDLMYPNTDELSRPERTESVTVRTGEVSEEFNLAEDITELEFDQLKDTDYDALVDDKVLSHVRSLRRKLNQSYKNKFLKLYPAFEVKLRISSTDLLPDSDRAHSMLDLVPVLQ